MTPTDGSTDVVLVNDLDSLREAVSELAEIYAGHLGCDPDYCDIGVDLSNFRPEAETLINLVPRLIKSYEDLLEASFELTRLVELEHQNRTPEGLYLP
jgi:hypothetical protein